MKIITYNVNGIRAAITKGFVEWLKASQADMVCLQEVKAQITDIDPAVFEELGYQLYWYSAQKKGYSGVAILTKHKPIHVEYGCGMADYDFEGRVIRCDFETFSLMSVYMPSGSSGDDRQGFKMKFLADFEPYLSNLIKSVPNLIISGDYNICHQAIDIHNPKANANSSGFLPEERAWLGGLLNTDFIDTFRFFNPEPHQYTWWSFRAGARQKNLGWRIDHHLATKSLESRLSRAMILPEAKHSDHCPVVLVIDEN